MVFSSSSSSSSLDLAAAGAKSDSIKFLCSYGGKILPRYPDGKLRYVGGNTRLLSVHRSVVLSELQGKLMELCGWSDAVGIRCQLPADDTDVLVSVTSSNADLAALVEENDAVASRDRRLLRLKIRAFLFPKPSDALLWTSSSAAAKGKKTSSGRAAAVPAERCASGPGQLHRRQGRTAAGAGDLRFHVHHHPHGVGHGTPRPCNYPVYQGN